MGSYNYYYGTSGNGVSGVSGSQDATGCAGATGTCGTSSSSLVSGLTTFEKTYTKNLPLLEDFEIIEIKKEVIPTFKNYFDNANSVYLYE